MTESFRPLPPRVVRIVSVDLALPAAEPFLRSLLGKSVSVWINGNTVDNDRVTGLVYLDQEDINRTLLSGGLGRYVKPPPYSVSDYSDCLFRIAQREARAHRRGLWAF